MTIIDYSVNGGFTKELFSKWNGLWHGKGFQTSMNTGKVYERFSTITVVNFRFEEDSNTCYLSRQTTRTWESGKTEVIKHASEFRDGQFVLEVNDTANGMAWSLTFINPQLYVMRTSNIK
eukprot:Pgem_evm1s5980